MSGGERGIIESGGLALRTRSPAAACACRLGPHAASASTRSRSADPRCCRSSRRRQSKKKAPIGSSARSAATFELAAEAAHGDLKRVRTPRRVEGDRLAVEHQRCAPRSRAHRLDDFRHGGARPRSVRACRCARPRPPCATWMRAPSIFHSNAASPLELEERLAHVGGGLREHGRDGREQLELESVERRRVRRRARRVRTAPRLFAYIAARRTALTGSSAAAAIASTMTPPSAPCRSSPSRSRARNSRSAGVARDHRSRKSSMRRPAAPAPFIPGSSASRRIDIAEGERRVGRRGRERGRLER